MEKRRHVFRRILVPYCHTGVYCHTVFIGQKIDQCARVVVHGVIWVAPHSIEDRYF